MLSHRAQHGKEREDDESDEPSRPFAQCDERLLRSHDDVDEDLKLALG